MKRALAVALSACVMTAVTSGPAKADWSVGVAAEHFTWKESTTPTVKETGLRWALDLTWAQSKQPGFSAGYNLKLYVGNVDYEGAFLGSLAPLSNETHYQGLTNEAQLIYRTARSPVDFTTALGWDHWNRKLSAIQKESYDVLYWRLGAALNATAKDGVLASLGAKFPLWIRENAHLTDLGFSQNPRLHPGRDFSLYGTLGYRFNPGWDLIGYYDSYRFKQSGTEFVTQGAALFGVFQPRSRMDIFGVKLQHNF